VDVPTSKAEKVTTVIKPTSGKDSDEDVVMEIMKTKKKKDKKRKQPKSSS